MTPAVIILALISLGVIGATSALVVRFLRQRPQWQDLGYLDIEYAGAVDVTRLRTCLKMAASFIAGHGNFSPEAINTTMRGMRVLVRDTQTWDLNGTEVSGQADEGGIIIGSDLLSLGHELSHFIEFRLTGKTDSSHASWNNSWKRAAEAAYENWLQGK